MAESWFSEPMRLAYLVVLCVSLAAVESLLPFVRFPRERRHHYLPNLVLSVMLIMSNLALAALPTAASIWSMEFGLGLCRWLALNNWLILLVGVAGLDLTTYWAHRTLHLAQLGWRFHSVHHSEPYVDVTTTFRQHPVETLWRIAFTTLGVAVLGVPLWCLAIYLAISASNALLEHCNLALPPRVDRWLQLIFVTPNMHKVHHSRSKPETNSNYSNILSIWDRVFRTFRSAKRECPVNYGLDGYDCPHLQSIGGVLLQPLYRRNARRQNAD